MSVSSPATIAFHRGGSVSRSRWNTVARPGGALRGLEEHAPAVQSRGQNGVWERVFQHLATDANNEYAMIDSTIVRAYQHSAGAQKKPVRTRRSGDRAVD